MSLRLDRLWLMLGLFIAGETFALGLGDIELNSALNEPLRAEIQLVSASAEDLAGLTVALASSETFERYGLYRPLYLTRLQFNVERSGGTGGNVIAVRSEDPITEPFVTFLVEATWPSGRMLREYTVLLDPPTFARSPSAQSAQAVTAPSRAAPADSGRIERSSSAAESATPANAGPARTAPFDAAAGGEVRVERGDTLWGIAQRVRPDNRLSMNQTMVAIFDANPQAFAGNINRLEAGSTLSIPSADDIFRITRGEAMTEVQRQNSAFGLAGGGSRAEPRLTLVPPDSEQEDYRAGASGGGSDASNDAALDARIRELEATIAEQQSLIEVRDNELAQLREELTRIREEAALAGAAASPEAAAGTAEAPTDAVEETDRVFADDTAVVASEDETAADSDAEAQQAAPAPAPERAVTTTVDEPGLLDRLVGALTGFWGILGIVLLLVLGILVWLAKRAAGRGEEESTGVWDALDAGDDVDSETLTSTERLRSLAQDDDSSIVVVEQETSAGRRAKASEPSAPAAAEEDLDSAESTADTGVQPALEDTFSSESAINLVQSDPIAEADFHMAYGLYDQAADLINGALAVEPERQDLMAKLCEVYFVWGNRDAFVDAASRLHDQLGGESGPEWDKIVIMGKQIAGDHKLFSGVSTGAATQVVDLSFDSEDEAGALDMDFAGGPDGEVSNVVDLGADDGSSERSGLDFMFDDELDTGSSTTRDMPGRDGGNSDDATVESPTIESRAADSADESPTVESPTVESEAVDRTIESPTVEQSFDRLDSTSELPVVSATDDDAPLDPSEATAEIDLDDLGLDLHDLAAAGLDDDSSADLSEPGERTESDLLGANDDLDDLEATGRNPGFENDDDPETSSTGIHEGFDLEALTETAETSGLDDADGKSPVSLDTDEQSDTDIDLDTSLLDATGLTQVLSADSGVDLAGESIADDDKTQLAPALGDTDAETLLASLDDEYAATAALSREEVDFDFAKTEALPKDAFSPDSASDETGEMPSLAGGTDVDLDLDDLTAALRLSEGDTVDQPRDEPTVERPRIQGNGLVDLDLGALDDVVDDAPTEALSPEEFNDDLHEARTMTEVGTKLDLARAYVDMGDPDGARSILGEVLEEGDDGQRQQAQKLIDALPA